MSKYKYHDWNIPVDEKKLSAFWKKVASMAKQEFGVDESGCATVEVRLTDRTRTHSPHFQDMPYGHRSDEARKQAFEVAAFNLGVAYNAFDTEDRIRRHHEHEATLCNEKLGIYKCRLKKGHDGHHDDLRRNP